MITLQKQESTSPNVVTAHAEVEVSRGAKFEGYAVKVGESADEVAITKYFILDENLLTYHEDQEHSNEIQGKITVGSRTDIKISDGSHRIIHIINSAEGERWVTLLNPTCIIIIHNQNQIL